MARTFKYIARAVIGLYSGSDYPVMPTGIMSDVNAQLVKRKYRKCENKFDSNSLNDLKIMKRESFFESFYFFLCDINFWRGIRLLSFECFPVNCFIHSNPPRLTFQVIKC